MKMNLNEAASLRKALLEEILHSANSPGEGINNLKAVGEMFLIAAVCTIIETRHSDYMHDLIEDLEEFSSEALNHLIKAPVLLENFSKDINNMKVSENARMALQMLEALANGTQDR
jgi:hypothetical protein